METYRGINFYEEPPHMYVCMLAVYTQWICESDISMFGLAYNQTSSRVSLYLYSNTVELFSVSYCIPIAGCLTLFGWHRMWVWVHAVTAMEWNGRASISVAANQQ